MKKKRNQQKNVYLRNHIPELKEHALKTSIKDGIASNLTAVGDSYITPFALALNAQPIHIGILSSLSGLLYQISQLFGSKLMERYSRKKIVLFFVFLQAITWLFISLIAFLVWKDMFNTSSIWILILFYSMLMFFSGIHYPSWFSWMGDLVPEEKRGEYFSKRNRIGGAAGIIALMIAAFFLDYYKTKGYVLLAFSILFAIASLFKFVSYYLLTRQYVPQFKQKKKDYFSFLSFIRRYDNFGKFAVYQGFFNLAIMVASPFFNVYMLEQLNFSYTIFTISNVSYILFYLIFLPLAGKFSDKYGNRRLTVIANIFYIITPIFYMMVKSPLGVILLPQLSAGIANAALVISFSNFTYDAVRREKRSLCITYTNNIIGIGTFIGALLGGFIVSSFHPATINPYIFVFGVSALLRFSAAIFFLPKIKEVRKVKRLPSEYNFFSHPLASLHHGSARLLHIPEKALGKFKSLKFL